MIKEKLIVIVGPTASGKTALSVELARALQGEVISADSRQVYRGLDLGSGKVTKREMCGVPHHCIDIASPRSTVSVERWRREALRALKGIYARGHVPIVAGGTGFYIDALVFGTDFPAVPPNMPLRATLARKTPEELLELLSALDPERAATVEQRNPRRLIRAIEVATALGKVPPLKRDSGTTYMTTWIGICPPPDILRQKIHDRIFARMRQGMLAEVRDLHVGDGAPPLSWERLKNFGLEYRYLTLHLEGTLSRGGMLEALEREIVRYSKRQMTWFKRNPEIRWYPDAVTAARAELPRLKKAA